jgi:hypothetical protein
MQWKTQNTLRPKKHACLDRRSRPCLCFFDHKGMVHYEFIAQGQTVNQQCYLDLLTKLRECVWRKRPRLWPDKWILHHEEFIAQGQTVNQQCYLDLLTKLRECVWRKRLRLCPEKWILHHDNAAVHEALRFRKFLGKNSITKMDHPPYSPALHTCDF